MTITQHSPEIVIGIVGRIGIDRDKVFQNLNSVLKKFSYEPVLIKLTNNLSSFSSIGDVSSDTIEGATKKKIEACNGLRDTSKNPAIMSVLALIEIEKERRARATVGLESSPPPLNRVAYIIDQIKRPEESRLLRGIYGELYIQLSCHSPNNTRMEFLSAKIGAKHYGENKADNWIAQAAELIKQDDHEESVVYGQRVQKVFPEGDFILDTTSSKMEIDISRFFSLYFGSHKFSPTRDEYGMALAATASLRSLSGARQVGASILSPKGEVIALGCNEVPKYGGGSYWEGDDNDARDVTIGTDQNFSEKIDMMAEILSRLSSGDHFSEHFNQCTVEQLLEEFLHKDGAPLQDVRLMDTLEFGRDLHAEMSALIDAARLGVSTAGAVLYCNTFPCHNCTKHIIAAGISKVVYLKPFQKSYAKDLFSDSIAVDSASVSKNKIPFAQFTGLAPTRFHIFEKGKLSRDSEGTYEAFQCDTAFPNVPPADFFYFDNERQLIDQSISDLPPDLRVEFESIKSQSDNLPAGGGGA